MEKKLGKESEHNVWLRIRSSAFVVFKIGAELCKGIVTKQSFCHWVISLKWPPLRKTGRRNKGAAPALNKDIDTG
jgi:hypothetical protein